MCKRVKMKFDGFSLGIFEVMGVFSEEVHVLPDSRLKRIDMPGGTHLSRSSYLCSSWLHLLPGRKIGPS